MINICKTVLSAVAIAAAVFGAAVTFGTVADAKPATCSARHTSCTERCIMAAGNEGGGGCITRTCDRQYNNCMSESSGGGERGGGGGRAEAGGGGGPGKSSGKPVVRDHRK